MPFKCIFLGYAPNQKGYKCYHPSSRKHFVFLDMTFHETVFFFSPSQPHLQGEKQWASKDKVAIPLPTPPYLFLMVVIAKSWNH